MACGRFPEPSRTHRIAVNTTALWLAATILTTAPFAPPPPAPPDSAFSGQVAPGAVILTGEQSRGPQPPPPRPTGPQSAGDVAQPTTEYRVVPVCGPGGGGPNNDENSCQSAVLACTKAGLGPGPLSNVYSRAVGTTTWTPTGQTCIPSDYPAATTPVATLTLADIQRAFAETPFATPIGSSQPVGGRTLVNLPTYFALTWPDQGYRPGQTRSLTMLGHAVDLRLKTGGHRYDYGDGATHGPTTSTGGPYPTGDITHTYRRAGTLTPTATTVITADYRIEGGPWQPLPGSSTQTTTFPTLTVLTATNRLTADPT